MLLEKFRIYPKLFLLLLKTLGLETINDNFPKVVVSIDDMVLPSHNGIKHIQAWNLRNELIYHKE